MLALTVGTWLCMAYGVGEAATAVNNAAHYTDPGMKVFPGYSTTIMKRRERKEQKKGATA